MRFFNGKKVAITGANGFVGSWLTQDLIKNGADVTILLKRNSIVGKRSITPLLDNLSLVYGDLRDVSSVKKLLKDKDIVFHLAAITQVIYAKNRPAETFDINTNGTLNLLEAARLENNPPFIVYMSTDKVYGEPKYLPIDEKHPLLARSPYDVSKMAADCLMRSYHETYGMDLSTIRCSNIIGGRDANFLRIVPDVVRSIIKNEQPKIRGDGRNIRDYMYVSDSISALMMVATKQNVSSGEIFNIGTERPTSVLDIANMIIKLAGNRVISKPVILKNNISSEINRQYLSSKKAKQLLGWRPKYGLEEGLKNSIDWYLGNLWWQEVLNDNIKNYKRMNITY